MASDRSVTVLEKEGGAEEGNDVYKFKSCGRSKLGFYKYPVQQPGSCWDGFTGLPLV